MVLLKLISNSTSNRNYYNTSKTKINSNSILIL